MSPRSDASNLVLTAGAALAILGLAVAAFHTLPEHLAYNEFVGGSIFAATILLASAVARVTDPAGESPRATGSER